MQQFQVPQFIDIEDKVFGPLTVKQFLYVLGGTSSVVILWFLRIPSFLFWPLGGIIGGFFFSLAFMKVNGQPFVTVVNNAVSHITQSRFYVWKRVERKEAHKAMLSGPEQQYIPKLTQSKLKDLSWSLDIKSKVMR